MSQLFSNNASTTLSAPLTNVATSMTVTSGAGFTTPTLGKFEIVTIENIAGTVREIVKVTARSGNTFTIVRAQEGTTAQSFSSGDKVEGRITSDTLSRSVPYTLSDSSTAITDPLANIFYGKVNTGSSTNAHNYSGVTLLGEFDFANTANNLTFSTGVVVGKVTGQNIFTMSGSSITVGYVSNSNTSGNITLGNSSVFVGNATGESASPTAFNGIVIGSGVIGTTYGTNSITITNSGSTTVGNNSINIGNSSTISSSDSINIGNNNSLSGTGSTIVGASNTVAGTNSSVIGCRNVTLNDRNTTVIGAISSSTSTKIFNNFTSTSIVSKITNIGVGASFSQDPGVSKNWIAGFNSIVQVRIGFQTNGDYIFAIDPQSTGLLNGRGVFILSSVTLITGIIGSGSLPSITIGYENETPTFTSITTFTAVNAAGSLQRFNIPVNATIPISSSTRLSTVVKATNTATWTGSAELLLEGCLVNNIYT